MTKKYSLNWLEWALLLMCATALALLITSCASVSPTFDDKGKVIGGSSYGFFRDMKLDQTVNSDGSSRMVIETKSTTSDIMKAGNEIIGTASGIASKLAP